MVGGFRLFHLRQLTSYSFRGLGYVAILLLERLLRGLHAFWEETRTISRGWLDENDLDGRYEEAMVGLVRAFVIGVTLLGVVSLSYIIVWVINLAVGLI